MTKEAMEEDGGSYLYNQLLQMAFSSATFTDMHQGSKVVLLLLLLLLLPASDAYGSAKPARASTSDGMVGVTNGSDNALIRLVG